VDAAVVLESLLDTNRNLAVKAMPACVDRSADNAREVGIEKQLPADDNENSGSLGIRCGGMSDSIEVTPPHGMT
jgi:hypothetical protein